MQSKALGLIASRLWGGREKHLKSSEELYSQTNPVQILALLLTYYCVISSKWLNLSELHSLDEDLRNGDNIVSTS